MNAVETYEHDGVQVNIYYDEDGNEWNNPRNSECNLTTMVCWHPDYVLGDYQFKSPNERGAVETPYLETWKHDNTFASMEQLGRYIGLAHKGICILPLYLYDHSGISISAGYNPMTFDSQGWDTTIVGFVYTTHERITELCGDGAEYHSDEWIIEQVRNDVKHYDSYLRGECYGYIVDEDGPDEDSCWGYVGDIDYCKEEANDMAEYVAKARRSPDRIYVDAVPIEEHFAGMAS